MKKIITICLAGLMSFSLYAQEADSIARESEVEISDEITQDNAVDEAIKEAIEENGGTSESSEYDVSDDSKITIGQNEVLIVEENGDTVRVVLGSRGISVVETDEGTVVKILDMDETYRNKHSKSKKRFHPHFAGVEVGLNNYLAPPDMSMTMPPEYAYMDLNTGKSWNWNINIIDYGFGLGTDYVGIASGLGFEFINYNFDGQNSIMKDPDTGETIEYVPDYAGNISKSKLNMTYLYAPLLLEFQIPAGRKRVFISGGVIGGVKLCSNTKIKYTVAGEKSKEKVKSDFNLAPLRWGFTARVGYRNLGFFANYYMTPLFQENGGPDLNPFSIGLAIGGW